MEHNPFYSKSMPDKAFIFIVFVKEGKCFLTCWNMFFHGKTFRVRKDPHLCEQ